jgi:hypothetical protein
MYEVCVALVVLKIVDMRLMPRSSEDVARRAVYHFWDEHRRPCAETAVSFLLIVLIVFAVEIATL